MSGAGVEDEANIFSKIVSLKIAGQALGSLTAEHFGIVAQNIGSIKVGATQLPLLAGNSNDDFEISITGNLRVREI